MSSQNRATVTLALMAAPDASICYRRACVFGRYFAAIPGNAFRLSGKKALLRHTATITRTCRAPLHSRSAAVEVFARTDAYMTGDDLKEIEKDLVKHGWKIVAKPPIPSPPPLKEEDEQDVMHRQSATSHFMTAERKEDFRLFAKVALIGLIPIGFLAAFAALVVYGVIACLN